MFGKCIAYDDCATEVSWLCLLAASGGKKALPFTGLRPPVCPSVLPSIRPSIGVALRGQAPLVGCAALPFLSVRPQTTSKVWQPCRAPTCCPGLAWFVLRHRCRTHSSAIQQPCLGNANRGHGSIKERRKRMLAHASGPNGAPPHWHH